VSEEYLPMQEQLLKEVDSIKNKYSFLMFLENHLTNWELLNCRSIQEDDDHDCLRKGMACKVRFKIKCGCKADLLQCGLVLMIKIFKEKLLPILEENKPESLQKY